MQMLATGGWADRRWAHGKTQGLWTAAATPQVQVADLGDNLRKNKEGVGKQDGDGRTPTKRRVSELAPFMGTWGQAQWRPLGADVEYPSEL